MRSSTIQKMKQTKHFNINNLAEAAEILRNGGLIAFPTETVYGLGADATNDAACNAIYVAKGRPNDNPFIVHVCSISEIEQIALVCPLARKLFETFSPGPITVVMKRKSSICATASAGLDSIGVRIPSHPVAQDFLKLCDVPVAAPSANISGQISPTTADMVLRDLSGRIDGIIKSDDIECGLESTVVSVLDGKVQLLRSGAISLEQLEDCLQCEVEVADELKAGEIMRSPGQKYKHYSPAIPLELIDDIDADTRWRGLVVRAEKYINEKIGILMLHSTFGGGSTSVGLFQQVAPVVAGKTCKDSRAEVQPPLNTTPNNLDIRTFENVKDYARELYQTMDEMGRNGCTRIIAVLPPNIGIGRAIRNRLMRAATK